MSSAAIVDAMQAVFLLYFVAVTLVYGTLNLVSLRVTGREARARTLVDIVPQYTGLEPPVTIIVPAYNEAAVIVESVRSLLQLNYADYEVVVVNDGSTDATLDVLTAEFGLRPSFAVPHDELPARNVHGMWRSAAHPRLRVVDKDNGGKADAMNAGINAARFPLVCVIDADSILQRDSLQRVTRPFLEDPAVIAVGGTVRIANGCTVSGGYLEAVGMPRSWLARFQILEYLRGFLFGRMGWSPVNALLIISGAFGVFSKAALVRAGGFRTDTIGEDMEVVTRLHRLARLDGRRYRIAFVPDPVCWTEAPERLRDLRRQRIRWQRGLLESLWLNRALLFHPRGGTPGWLAFPTMLLIEGIGPIVELAGYVVFGALFAVGVTSFEPLLAYALLAFGSGLVLSANAVLLEEMTFRAYPSLRNVFALLGAVILESFGYRQLTVWWRFEGIVQWAIRSRPRWETIPRSGNWVRQDS